MKNQANPIIQIKESDLNSVRFDFRVLDDGTKVDLTGTTVSLAVQKPSGLTVVQDCTIIDATNGICELILTNQAYLEIGNHTAELILTKADVTSVTRTFEFSTLNAILDDETLQSANDWQALHQIMLNADLRPILGDGTPNGIVTPEYQGQTYLDRIGMTMFYASTLVNDGWLPFGGGGGGGTGTVYWNDVLLKPSTFAPSAHQHVWADITDKPTQFAPTAHSHDWATGITNKPLAFTPEAHSHAITDITNLQATLDGKADDTDIAGKANVGDSYLKTETYSKTEVYNKTEVDQMTFDGGGSSVLVEDNLTSTSTTNALSANQGRILNTTKSDVGHGHAIADVTDLQLALDGKADDADLAGKSDVGHVHTIANITNLQTTLDGKADDADLAGKSDVGHVHTIANVTNLQTTLDGKQPKPTSVTAIPTTTPTHLGQIAVDGTNKNTYIAEGTASGDWKKLVDSYDLSLKSDVGHTHTKANISDFAHTHTEADLTISTKNAKTYVDDADNYILNTVLGGKKIWTGTQTTYNGLTKDANTLYFITGA